MDSTSKIVAPGNEKGMVIVYVALLMTVLLGFLGLAVDSAHLFKVGDELQTAADAAALKGAYFLYSRPTDPTQRPVLQFSTASAKAGEIITVNGSDTPANNSGNQLLRDATVTAGYWDLRWDSSMAQTLMPDSWVIPEADRHYYVPAVQVEFSRSGEKNGGPVQNFFMQLVNDSHRATAVSSQAVAMSGFAGSVPPGMAFPIAIAKCVTDHYFAQDPLPSPPTEIRIGPGGFAYLPGGASCYTGQWTSFLVDSDVDLELIDRGNPAQLTTGDRIHFANAPALTSGWLPAGGIDVEMAIVDSGGNNFSDSSQMEVTGFVNFHLEGTGVSGGSSYIYGHFNNYFTAPTGVRPGGTISNIVTRPTMAQ